MGASFDDRGADLDTLIDQLQAIWDNKAIEGADTPIGPEPYTDGGPPIVLGGASPRALTRAGQRADAWICAPSRPDDIAANYEKVREAAEQHGRPVPRLFAAYYFALGDVADEVRSNVATYYRFLGPDLVDLIHNSVLRTPDAIAQTVSALEAIGVDEVWLWPQARGLHQLNALADALGL
jgi:alkanesulfonate monooxygenase SsuD/methylene tetrahydromethanopterin reductase-like flavin-dependent oxidoreductase (luciferase family)